jgi:hypothetical protein
MKAIMLMTGLLLLTGCAGQPPEGLARLLGGGSCGKPAADQQLSLDMADQMIGEGRPHAGLAHLEQLPETLDQVRLRKAKVLRLLGREAEPLYRSLLGGCLAAEGEHGLGQIAAARATTPRPCVTCSAQRAWRRPMKKCATTWAWCR